MNNDVFLTSDLARAARAFTKVSAQTIADAAGLTRAQVRNFERGKIDLPLEAKARLKETLERYGALFIPEEEHAGYGVRRRLPREGYMKLNVWEAEGGQPG